MNNVTPEFAYRVRSEERLAGLRSLLRKIWGTAQTSPDGSTAERQSSIFAEELQVEYRSARSDWVAMDRDFTNSVNKTAWAAGLAAGGSALSAGVLGIAISAIGFGAAFNFDRKRLNQRRNEFKEKVPMSIFIDLARENSS